jgi:hypothetical protein
VGDHQGVRLGILRQEAVVAVVARLHLITPALDLLLHAFVTFILVDKPKSAYSELHVLSIASLLQVLRPRIELGYS